MQKFEELSKKKKKIERIIDKQKEIELIQHQIEENKAILKAGEENDLIALAETEIIQLEEKLNKSKRELETLQKEDKDSEPNSVIIEIRAGTGGEEASLFAADLFRMYSKYATLQSWSQKILDSHPTDINGFKDIIFELKGPSVFQKMKYEGGVHRVQRIPKTEKTGRVHTSTATVAVLPKPKETEIKIRPDEIRIETYKASGPGGQYVNKTESAVRIFHLPTGLIVASQSERNQLKNKENALSILRVRLFEKKEREQKSLISGKRKTQIGQAKRAEKIRTYNFPQDRITDHRIKKNWHNIEEIMEGKIDKIIKDLEKNGI